MGVTFAMNDNEVRLGLGELAASVADTPALLNVAGILMRASVARTFREQGSPAGSWPKLALSTLKKKGYSARHKLLIMSGRLFRSIDYSVQGETLTIGTNVVYARVHQLGSRDRSGGSVGAQAKLADRAVKGKRGTRHQNIPARPFLVFRPEDPQRIISGWEAYLKGKAVRIGVIGKR